MVILHPHSLPGKHLERTNSYVGTASPDSKTRYLNVLLTLEVTVKGLYESNWSWEGSFITHSISGGEPLGPSRLSEDKHQHFKCYI